MPSLIRRCLWMCRIQSQTVCRSCLTEQHYALYQLQATAERGVGHGKSDWEQNLVLRYRVQISQQLSSSCKDPFSKSNPPEDALQKMFWHRNPIYYMINWIQHSFQSFCSRKALCYSRKDHQVMPVQRFLRYQLWNFGKSQISAKAIDPWDV